MSQKEVLKLQVMENLKNKKISQSQASKILKISCRQIRRLIKKYKRDGAESLISKKRGKPSNNRICEVAKRNILEIIKEKYSDFGPTFLGEKLFEIHGIKVSKESLRQLMINEHIWKAKRAKKAQIHQMRERRSCFGELIQIDGSPHDWFEGRAKKCCLLVFIDDATGILVNLRFEETETTIGYFKVERANGILQDRLVKEMRLRAISDMAIANAYLPEFIEHYNKKFAVEPKNSADAHVKLSGNENLELSYYNTTYQIKTKGSGYCLRHAKVTICEDLEGKISIIYKGDKLTFSCYKKQKKTAEIVEAKALNDKIDSIAKRSYKPYKPMENHPWKQYKITKPLPIAPMPLSIGS